MKIEYHKNKQKFETSNFMLNVNLELSLRLILTKCKYLIAFIIKFSKLLSVLILTTT